MYLLDTNVVSELRKIGAGKGDRSVSRWSRSLDVAELFLSVVTIEEIEVGVLRIERQDPAQGKMFRTWLDEQVLPAFENRILPVDLQVARMCASLHVPDPRPIRDAMIGATALAHGLTLATRNVGDFEPMGVELVNPWV
ncbi:MAG: type II toxin-antitoxin system VapC family toxin [Gammaproteobacteria bacterium]|nr:type II toxin-antitoxin system VapC family toxin [Gammaproteobacteria bacterium]MYA67826.1 type II toxin-antitoxin system VapC family toxin [Gammaproteobacteria bacterium]MYH45909.1 type II toxin-antitoxin system VapC family toxin [Gammaproteobacteria bacterium]MYL13348.1 type II toxin-antitoxin system VapC family toxin [Gammaproteobacteria bacterium]